MKYIIALGMTCTLLGGCSSVVTAWKADPIQIYPVKKATVENTGSAIYTMTGERRTAVVMNRMGKDAFCAESLPEAASAYGAKSGATAKGAKIEGSFSDDFALTLLQTYQRTEISEIYRQMAWNTCLAWAQQAISDAQYQALVAKMVTGGIEVMKMRATPTPVKVTKPAAAKPAAAKPVAAKKKG